MNAPSEEKYLVINLEGIETNEKENDGRMMSRSLIHFYDHKVAIISKLTHVAHTPKRRM